MTIREAVKRAIGRKGRLLVRRVRNRRWAITPDYQHLVRGLQCLEIGGPTDMFGFGGFLPIYSCVGAIDNCNFSEDTIWSSDAPSRIRA